MQESATAERMNTRGEFDPLAYDAEMEKLETDFATNGDRAVKAAEEADTDQSKASLLNVAVRSYLKASG